MKRKIYESLKKWKNNSGGNSALLIDGARRVGKSYIVNEFAKNEYKSYIIIDFTNVSPKIIDIFENDSYDLDLFLNQLSLFFRTKLYKRESLMIFDEVQIYPKARQLIKHLVADGRYDYIETGSLISLRRNVENIVIPSEEEHLLMYPMDFEEFLWAMGDIVTIDMIKNNFLKSRPLGEAIHRRIMKDFRQYILTGGMPQSVQAYVDTKDFEKVDVIKKNILTLYRNDVTKFAKGYESKVLAVFDQIPSQLSKHEKRFNLSSLGISSRFRTYEDSFVWLSEAMITNNCYRSNDPSVGLALNSENSSLKCYFMDTGLLVSQIFSDMNFNDKEIYHKILFDKLGFNEGMIMENIVAQMLKSSGHNLYFFSKVDENNKNVEIDFLINRQSKISPIEVKSSNYTAHSSIDKFTKKFGKKIGQPYIIYTKDLKVVDGIICIPIYMTMFL